MWWINTQTTTSGWADNVGGTPVEYGITPITGFRSWFVTNHDGGLALRSMHMGSIWHPGANTAECNPRARTPFSPPREHEAPDIDCSCGFYSQLPDHPFNEWQNMLRARVSAAGQISMWGRIIQCERGYKAQHVRLSPDDPVVLETSCQAGCDNEPTKVHLPSYQGKFYWAYCDDHAAPDAFPEQVSVEAAMWLRHACKELTERYDREFINWSQL